MTDTWAISHPVTLEFEHSYDSDDLTLAVGDCNGKRMYVRASRMRWQEALMPRLGPRPSPAQQARAMYERDELPIEAFEAELDRELRRVL